jgi:hypothetical protein
MVVKERTSGTIVAQGVGTVGAGSVTKAAEAGVIRIEHVSETSLVRAEKAPCRFGATLHSLMTSFMTAEDVRLTLRVSRANQHVRRGLLP